MRARDCKIVATMGPASDAPERLAMLIQAGVDCFRLNFSHGAREDHARRMAAIRAAEAHAGTPVGVFADLQGPKIRVGMFEGGEIKLRFNDIVTIEGSSEAGSAGLIRMPHPELVNALEPGDILKLDDGKIQLTITESGRTQLKARVDFGGVLKNQKGVNVPTRRIPISALTEKDREDLAYALDLGVDYIALSFVQHAEDVHEARALVVDRAGIIAKIEKPSALTEIESIVEAADAVMVARGDLGVELPPEQVPIAQRKIIRTARAAGKPVIVATHMLESMVEAATPTRAEASDVATAVYQGADAVMLSAESAVGRHPQSAVAIMDRIIRAVEDDEEYWASLPRDMTPPQATTADAIALSARHIADVIGCKALVAYTATGSSAIRVARERPRCGVIGLTPFIETARKLALVWGVRSVVTEDVHNVEEMVDKADAAVRKLGVAEVGDRVAIIAGIPFGAGGEDEYDTGVEAGMILRRIAEHVKAQNWVAIGIDFVIVVLGVFVATQVSNWNDANRDRQRGQSYLESIHGELQTDATAIERRIAFWRQVSGYGESALAYAEHGTLKDGSAWQTVLAFFQASQIWPYTATDTTYRELTGAGELGLIRDRSMRAALADYYVVRKGRLDPLFAAMPRYREDIRGLTPMNVQSYIWNNCHHSYAEGSEEMQTLVPCESPISEAEAREILRSYVAAPEVLRGLRFWMSTMRVQGDLSAHDRDTALQLAERIGAD